MLKNSKVVLFLSPYKVGQAGNFWTLLRMMFLCHLCLSKIVGYKKNECQVVLYV
jgi:hypothetical protein